MASKHRSKNQRRRQTDALESETSKRFSELVQTFSGYAPDELWPLVYATASSPAARHCAMAVETATIASIRAMSQRQSTTNQPPPLPNDLIETTRRVMDGCMETDDCVMVDPTNVAKIRIGDEVFKYVPGTTERPIADIDRALRLAGAIDDRITRKFKFGIVNVVRVLVKYVDFCVRHLEGSWQPAPHVKLGAPVCVPEPEIQSCKTLTAMDPCDHINFTDADLRALDWLSSPAASAHVRDQYQSGLAHRWVRYRTTGSQSTDYWLPVSMVPLVLHNAVTELMNSVKRDNHARQAVRVSFAKTVVRSLWCFADSLRGADCESVAYTPLQGNAIQWIMQPSADTIITVSLVLHDDLGKHSLETTARPILATQGDELDDGQSLQVPFGGRYHVKFDKRVNIIPLTIVAAASHIVVPQQLGHVFLSLEDLTWISSRIEDRQDFYRFCRDLASANMPASMGFEAIDYWETWNSNGKSFLRGARTSDLLWIEPHRGVVEWKRAVELSDTEEALPSLDLPALRDTIRAERHSNGSTEILFRIGGLYDPSDGLYTSGEHCAELLTNTHPPVAITLLSPYWEKEDETKLLLTFGGGLYYAFSAVASAWEQGHRTTEITGYRLSLHVDGEQSCPVLSGSRRIHGETNDVCYSRWSLNFEEILEHAQDDPQVINALTLDALATMLHSAGVASSDIHAITQQWKDAPPFVAIEAQTKRTTLNHLPSPLSIDSSDERYAERLLGSLLDQAGVKPGSYRGVAAQDLIRQTLVPGVLNSLITSLEHYDYQDVVTMAFTQLARVVDNYSHTQMNIVNAARGLEISWDPQERLAQLQDETFRLRQCNEILVELATLKSAQIRGCRPLDALCWQQLLALAESYRKLTVLSEQLHYKLNPCLIGVSELYEVALENDVNAPDAWRLDMADVGRSLADLHISPHGLEKGDGRAAENDRLSAAFLECYGFEILDLLTVLDMLARWEDFESGGCIARATAEEALDWVCQNLIENTNEKRERCQKVIEFLSLTQELLEADDWKPWKTQTRKSRLLVKPIVKLDTGDLVFAPQYVLLTLYVYGTYLKQGAIPWKDDSNGPLRNVLQQKRDEQNLSFEGEIEELLRESGYHVIYRIKPGKHGRLGVPKLTTEIDLVCGRPGSDEIWLIEAKDPLSVYSVSEIGRSLTRFFGNKGAGKQKKSYAGQLARKESELRPYTSQVAEKLGIQNGNIERFTLRSIFLTRSDVPAAHVKDAPYEVRVLSTILAQNEGQLIL